MLSCIVNVCHECKSECFIHHITKIAFIILNNFHMKITKCSSACLISTIVDVHVDGHMKVLINCMNKIITAFLCCYLVICVYIIEDVTTNRVKLFINNPVICTCTIHYVVYMYYSIGINIKTWKRQLRFLHIIRPNDNFEGYIDFSMKLFFEIVFQYHC